MCIALKVFQFYSIWYEYYTETKTFKLLYFRTFVLIQLHGNNMVRLPLCERRYGSFMTSSPVTQSWRWWVFILTSTCAPVCRWDWGDGVRRKRELTFAELTAASSPLSPYSLCVAVSFKMRSSSNGKLIVNGNFVDFFIINTVAPCSTPRGRLLPSPARK